MRPKRFCVRTTFIPVIYKWPSTVEINPDFLYDSNIFVVAFNATSLKLKIKEAITWIFKWFKVIACLSTRVKTTMAYCDTVLQHWAALAKKLNGWQSDSLCCPKYWAIKTRGPCPGRHSEAKKLTCNISKTAYSIFKRHGKYPDA